MAEPDFNEILDGLALWDEFKPQSGEDWIAVAERFIAAGETTEKSSPLFAAVVQAVRERDALSKPQGQGECDGSGEIVHPPSKFDVEHGESRRLHTPCPGCSRCQPQDQEGPKLTRDDGERLGSIATLIEETFGLPGAPITDNVSRDVLYLKQLSRSALQDEETGEES